MCSLVYYCFKRDVYKEIEEGTITGDDLARLYNMARYSIGYVHGLEAEKLAEMIK